jgi:hypothetical protein
MKMTPIFSTGTILKSTDTQKEYVVIKDTGNEDGEVYIVTKPDWDRDKMNVAVVRHDSLRMKVVVEGGVQQVQGRKLKMERTYTDGKWLSYTGDTKGEAGMFLVCDKKGAFVLRCHRQDGDKIRKKTLHLTETELYDTILLLANTIKKKK